jgi:hypothetical protein
MSDAGDTQHRLIVFGYLKLVTNDENGAPNGFTLVRYWFTPTLKHTFFSLGVTVKWHRKRLSGCTAYKDFTTGGGRATLHAIEVDSDVVIPGKLIRTSLFTKPLVLCSISPSGGMFVSQIRYLSERATRVIWHQPIHHLHIRRLAGLRLHINGIPPVNLPPDIEGCGTCWTCKLCNAARVTGDTRKDAAVPGKGISLDFTFIAQKFRDLSRFEKFLGLNGKTAYLLFTNHKTDMLFGIATVEKSPPLAWLNRWLAQYRPSRVSFWYACMDGGVELANNGDL